MNQPSADRNIRIEASAVGSAIVSGDGNTIYVIHQSGDLPGPPTAPPTDYGDNPYKGLAAFSEQDAERYFGREEQIQRLWQRFQALHKKPGQTLLLPILGPSGCGKSSLARAGLIPALARQPLPGKEAMRVAVLVPGTQPVEALAGVLAKEATQDPMPVAKTREIAEELRLATPEGRYDGLRRTARLLPQIQAMPLVVLVDQFEEVYSLCESAAEQEAFIGNLLEAAADPGGDVSVVLTLRSDFLGETQRHRQLNQLIGSDQSVIVPAMTEVELRRAITAPAEQAGHPLDGGTVDLLVKDTEGREGALPLLQFALTRMWEGLCQGTAAADTYRDIGGVGGALAGKAQEIYDSLAAAEQPMARRVFVGLVQLGEGTRDTRRRAAVGSLVGQDSLEAVKSVINRFAAPGARLITLASRGETETAEVTHEALFDHWQLLQTWLDSSRNDIRFQRRLEAAVEYWQRREKPKGLLWRPPDLDLLREFVRKKWGELTPLALEFYQAADRAERRERRIKRLGVVGLAVGLVLTTGLSGFAGYKVHQAERRRMRLYEATAKDLADTDQLGSLVHGLAAVGLGRSAFVKLPRLRRSALTSTALLDKANRIRRFNFIADHSDSVYSVAFSPDGSAIVSGGEDGTVQLLDKEGNQLAPPFEGHSDSVYSAAFSPDGSTIVSGGSDGTVRLWDREGNQLAAPFEGHSSSVRSVAFSPDGSTIVSGGDDGTVRLWNREGNQLTAPFEGHSNAVLSVAFSPDGSTIVSGGADGRVRLWDREGNQLTAPFEGHSGLVSSVAFSPDGFTIVSGGTYGRVRLWDREGNQLAPPFEGDSNWVGSVAFSPDGSTIVSGGADGRVRLWDREGNQLTAPFEDHLGWVSSVAFSSDGSTIVSGGEDGTVRLWNREGNQLTAPFEGHSDWVLSVAFSPSGSTIVSGGDDGTVRLWNREGNQLTAPFEGHSNAVLSVAFSPSGSTIISGGVDNTVRLWSREGNQLAPPFEGHSDWVRSVAFSPDGSTIISGGDDGTVRLWDREGNQLAPPFEGHSDRVRSVAFSPDGSTIISGGEDGTVRLWDREGNQLTAPFEGHSAWVLSAAFSPDGSIIISGGDDGTVRLWDREGNQLTPPLEGHSGWVRSVAFSPDGSIIISGGDDGTVRLWDREGNQLTPPLEGHSSSVTSVAFSPDSSTIVSGGGRGDSTLRLWTISFEGWIPYTCKHLRGYLNVQRRTSEVAREAWRTCERYAKQ